MGGRRIKKSGWRIWTMLNELQGLYRAGLINVGRPECMFPETLIFNEGWLLRLVLTEWLRESGGSRFVFLPFPEDVAVYSEGQLCTPFRGGSLRERNTHVDGIVGDFSIADTKSGIVLESDLRYIAAFEAKLLSPIGRGVKNARDYDQVSRTAACLTNSILSAKPQDSYSAHLVIVYAEDNPHIDPAEYDKNHIRQTIANRLETFIATDKPSGAIARFARGWKEILEALKVHFLTWEEVMADIGDNELSRFYELCMRFNA
jgi:hypothetical protein